MDILRIQNYPIYYISVHLIGQLATIIFAINYDYTSGRYNASAEQIAVGGKYELENNFLMELRCFN